MRNHGTRCLCALGLVIASLAVADEKHPTPDAEAATAQSSPGEAITAEHQTKERVIEFSGYAWSVKAHDTPVGPGPNYFSDRQEDLWVDDEGLHLTISKRDGHWYCTEVILEESLGYGSYIFQTKTEPDDLDPHAVAGMFTWEKGLPWPNRELDFEFARWSKPDDPTNAQFVIQPFDTPGNMLRYRVPPNQQDPHLTQVMTWQPGRVDFTTARGRFDSPRIPSEAVIAAWTYTGEGVHEPGKANARINLWLDDGKPPASKASVDLVVTKFLYLAPRK